MSTTADPVAPQAHAHLEREVTLLLRRSRAIHDRLGNRLLGGSDGAYALMVLLADVGPLHASDLVVRLGLNKSSISRQVASLADAGYITRVTHPTDGRIQVLSITGPGHRRLSELRDERRDRWQADLADWPTSDIAALGALLDRLNRLGEARERQDAPSDDPPPLPSRGEQVTPEAIPADSHHHPTPAWPAPKPTYLT